MKLIQSKRYNVQSGRMSSMYIRVRYHIIKQDSRNEGLALEVIACDVSKMRTFFTFIPAYEYNDRCDDCGEKHKTAEYSQGDHGPQI